MAEEFREVIIRIAIEEGGAKIRLAELDQLAVKLQLVASAHEEYRKKTEESTNATNLFEKAGTAAWGGLSSVGLKKLSEFVVSAKGVELAVDGIAAAIGATVDAFGKLGALATPPGLAALGTLAVGGGAIAYFKDLEDQAKRTGEELDRMIARVRAGKPQYVNPFEPVRRGTGLPDDFLAKIRAEDAQFYARFARRIDTAPTRFEQRDRMRQLDASRDPTLNGQLADLDRERKELLFKSRITLEKGDFGENTLRKEEVIGQRLKEVERQRFDILQKQGEQLRQNLATQQSAVKAAEDAVKAERQRLESLDETLGRLDPEQFGELKGILDKVQGGGKLTPEELARGEQLGGAGFRPFAAAGFAEIGRERGGADLYAPVLGGPQRGEGSDIERLQSIVKERRIWADDVKTVLEQHSNETEKQFKRLVDAVDEAFALATRAADRAASRIEAQNADRQRNQGAAY